MAEFDFPQRVVENQVEAGTFEGHLHTPLSLKGLVLVVVVVVGPLVVAGSRDRVGLVPEGEGHKLQVETVRINEALDIFLKVFGQQFTLTFFFCP